MRKVRREKYIIGKKQKTRITIYELRTRSMFILLILSKIRKQNLIVFTLCALCGEHSFNSHNTQTAPSNMALCIFLQSCR